MNISGRKVWMVKLFIFYLFLLLSVYKIPAGSMSYFENGSQCSEKTEFVGFGKG